MRCRAIQQPCTFFLCELTLLQHSFVRVQTRFTPYNTISYACKHVLRLAIQFRMRANTFYALHYDFVRVQTRFTPYNTISYACKHVLHRCNNSFGGQYELLRLATTDSGVNMSCCALQQLIRGAI